MHLHELRPSEGSRHSAKRVGRGHGSGHGKTSGRGQKGQNARSEGFRLGFEGGQMPLAQRIPKLGGFKNPFKKVFALVNLSKLSRFGEGATVDPAVFAEAGLAPIGAQIKVLGAGKLRRKLTVHAHAFSDSARAAIESRGGTVVVLGAQDAEDAEAAAEAAPARPKAKPAATEAAAEPAAEPAPGAKSETEASEPEG